MFFNGEALPFKVDSNLIVHMFRMSALSLEALSSGNLQQQTCG